MLEESAALALQIKMGDDDMTVVCTIIATAEYCSEVVGSLGRSIAKTLEPPYNEQVHALRVSYPNLPLSQSCIIFTMESQALVP